MRATVSFCYEENSIEVQCTFNEEMSEIFKKYAAKLGSSENNLDFFYEKKKISNDSTLLKLIGNRNKKNIIIFVKRKSKIIKCPGCTCNDTIIKIENFRLKFEGCKYNHSDIKIFDDYETTQKIDFSKIKCDQVGCSHNIMYNDFYKCLNCTKLKNRTIYYCSKCNNKDTKNHKKIEYNEKNYYCDNHGKQFINYCENCKKDLCEDCKNDLCVDCKENKHENHNIITYESMEAKIKNIRNSLDNIKNSMIDLGHVIENIRAFLEGSVDIIKKYCSIAEDIVYKYETYNKKLKNHRILQSVINLNDSNEKVMDKIKSIIDKKDDIKEQAQSIINIFLLDREDYIKGTQNNNNSLKQSNGSNN